MSTMLLPPETSVRLLPNDFAKAFNQPMSSYMHARIIGRDMRHRGPFIHGAQHDAAVLSMVKALVDDEISVSGLSKKPIWEKGWGENLKDFKPKDAGLKAAMPRYFNKHPIVRWQGRLYEAESENYEYDMLATIEDWLFDKYFRKHKAVYEFGCGTGHNLFRVRDVNPSCELIGLDWAHSAVQFINLQAKYKALRALSAHQFDFFCPNYDFKLKPSSGVYTVAALEQVGTNFGPWLDYIRSQHPHVVAHVEPINEVLDPGVLLDYLSLKYSEKRHYLCGYLGYLRQLQAAGKITIHEVVRTGIGSKFIEGYTVIVWSLRDCS